MFFQPLRRNLLLAESFMAVLNLQVKDVLLHCENKLLKVLYEHISCSYLCLMEILKGWAIFVTKMGGGVVDHSREMRDVREIRGGELT